MTRQSTSKCSMGKLFCNDCCKKHMKGNSCKVKIKKGVFRTITCLIFLCNSYGVVIFFLLFFQTIYAKVLFAIYAYLMLCTMISYFTVCFSNPGYVDQKSKDYKQMSSFCSLCLQSKPVRTHHCSLCDKCVLKMDHHCAWTQNCVGQANYGEFYHLIVITTTTLSYSIVIFILGMAMPQKALKLQYISLSCSMAITIIFMGLVINLVRFHVRLIYHNQTTIEYYYYENYDPVTQFHDKYPFFVSKKQNFKEVIPCWILLFTPIRIRSKIPFNGYYHVDPETGTNYLLCRSSSQSNLAANPSSSNLFAEAKQPLDKLVINQNTDAPVNQIRDVIIDLQESTNKIEQKTQNTSQFITNIIKTDIVTSQVNSIVQNTEQPVLHKALFEPKTPSALERRAEIASENQTDASEKGEVSKHRKKIKRKIRDQETNVQSLQHPDLILYNTGIQDNKEQ